jgi:dipeptidyl aminopeptidase/acylaminoacyl peptidase
VSKEEAYTAIQESAITGTPFESSLFEKRWRFYLFCRQQGRWPQEVAGHNPDEEHEWFDPYCPVGNISEEYPPTLLVHGDQDSDVPYEQSVLMATELGRHAVEYDLITLKGFGHGFYQESNGPRAQVVSEMFGQVLAFLKRHSV